MDVRNYVTNSRRAQGLSERVEDVGVIAQVARLVSGAKRVRKAS